MVIRRKAEAQKPLRTLDLVSLGVGGTIGSGIFLVPAVAAAIAGPSSILAWILCSISFGSVLMCLMWLSKKYALTGAFYTLFIKAYDRRISTLIILSYIISGIFGVSTIAAAIGENVQMPGMSPTTLVISVVLIFGTINLAGIVFTAWVEDILSALKILPLIIIPIILIPFIRIENFTPFSPKGDLAFLGSAVVVYWCYTGFELSAIPSREAKEPEKTVPRSLFLVFLAVTLIYLGINLSIIGTAGAEGVASTSAPISYAMDIAFKGSGNIVQIIALISMLSALNAYLIGTSLIMQSIGSSFGLKISKDSSRGVPAYMIAICVILSCVLLFFANYFVFLASASVILSLIPYIGLCYAAFKLVDRPLVKIVSITGIISTAAVLISTFII